MLDQQPPREHGQATRLKEEQTCPHALDPKGREGESSWGVPLEPEPAHNEERVDRVGRGQVRELALRQQDALEGHAAGVREEGAAEPRGEALHLPHDLGAGREEAWEEAWDEPGQRGVEPADAQADEDEPTGDLGCFFVGAGGGGRGACGMVWNV
jgi:hypothetical protein